MVDPTEADAILERLLALPGRPSPERVLVSLQPDLTLDHVRTLQTRVASLVRTDPAKALRLARLTVRVARLLRDRHAMAIAWRSQAEAHFLSGKLKGALRYYGLSISAYREAGERGEMARTMVGRMNLLAMLGRSEEAAGDSKRIVAILTAEKDSAYLAKYHMNRGNIHLNRDEYGRALRQYERARAFFDSMEIRDAAVVGLDVNRATTLTYLDRFEEALTIYGEARQEAKALGFDLFEAQITHNMGHTFLLSSRYHEALRYLRQARETFHRMNHTLETAKCDLNRSDAYLRLNLSREAAAMAEASCATFLEAGLGYDAGLSLLIAGRARSNDGEDEKALERLRRARAHFQRERAFLRSALVGLRIVQHELAHGRIDRARAEYRDAARELRNTPVRSVRALLLQIRSTLERKEGRIRRSRTTLRRVREIVRGVSDPWLHYQTFVLEGKLRREDGEIAGAIRSFERAADLAEKMRLELGADDFKLGFLADKQEMFDNLLELTVARRSKKKAERVFDVCERARARALLDQLRSGGRGGKRERRGGGRRAEKIEALERGLGWFRSKLSRAVLGGEPVSSKRVAVYKRRIRETERRILDLRRQMAESKSPVPEPVAAVPLRTVIDSLPPGETLVEYIVLSEEIHALCVTGEGASLVPLGAATADVRKLAGQLWNQIDLCSLPESVAGDRRAFLNEAVRVVLDGLYDALWRPLENRVRGESVALVPHAFLHGVPFHAFQDGERCLAERVAIRYAPSASIDHARRKRKARPVLRALLVGVPGEGLGSIEKEVGAVRRAFAGCAVSVRRKMSVSQFLDRSEESDLIHVATHGDFRSDNPAFSSLRLGEEDLHMYRLLEARIGAELVTLSACQTGASVIRKGEEPVGLARGFLLAGAASVVVSLWRVHDEAAAGIMKAFYRFLGEGLSKDEALRRASLHLRESHGHPYMWAPFILVGDSRPLRTGRRPAGAAGAKRARRARK